MDADRAHSPPGGAAEVTSPRGAATGDTGSGWGAVGTGVLDPVAESAGVPDPVAESTDRLGYPGLTPGTPPSSGGTRRNRRRTRWRLPVAYAVGVALLAAALAAGVGAHAQLDRTNAELTVVRARLHLTVDRAHRAQAGLAAVTAQSTDAARTLATETSQLASVEAQLASTESNVFANGVSINNLNACLSGVEQALNQISLNDQQGAAATLNGVAASCRASEPTP